MSDLYAITGPGAEVPGSANRRKHFKECRRRDLYMRVEGDGPVDPHFFDSVEFTLICRGDWVGCEMPGNVAAHLGRLYRDKGDSFVRGLRGSFAIVLYDHNQRTLKAWSDHFGAERLVYTEHGGSLAISTNIGLLVKTRAEGPDISAASIREYLQYTCIPTPRTIYEGISKLPPGHKLT